MKYNELRWNIKNEQTYDYYKNGRNNSMKPLKEILTDIVLNGKDYEILREAAAKSPDELDDRVSTL